MANKLCDVDCTLIHETDLAFLVTSDETGQKAWVPKAVAEFERTDQAHPDRRPPVDGTLTLPESWAIDKSLV